MAATTASVIVSTAAITHVSSGAALAAGAISGTADNSAGTITSANHGRYPSADVALTFTHTTSLSSASNALYLYRRDLDFDGTADEPVPGTAYATNSTISPSFYKAKLVGVFQANAVSLTGSTYSQSLQCQAVQMPAGSVEFYVENGTNAALVAGWTLKVTPRTMGAA